MAVVVLGLVLGMMAMGTTAVQGIVIDTVVIGDIGNANDPTTGFGGVNYAYAIGKYEVTLTQYTAFLNAVAVTDTYSLYSVDLGIDQNIAGIYRTGSNGSYSYSLIGSGNRPVTNVTWFDAARFANWMANGQPVGAQGNSTTEYGAYALDGAMTGWGFTKQEINPNTGQAVNWWIPSENEWYKAAYYSPGASSDSYWLYPTQSDTAPGNVIGSGTNQANYKTGVYSVTQNATKYNDQNYLTDGGAFSASASYYGTYDQGGNVAEWNDTFSVFDEALGVRGGTWFNSNVDLRSSTRYDYPSESEISLLGFRVASVPEPSTGVLVFLGGAIYWLVRRKKVTL